MWSGNNVLNLVMATQQKKIVISKQVSQSWLDIGKGVILLHVYNAFIYVFICVFELSVMHMIVSSNPKNDASNEFNGRDTL